MIDYRIPIDPSETPRVTARRLIDEAVLGSEPASAATLPSVEQKATRGPRSGGCDRLLDFPATCRAGRSHSVGETARRVREAA